MRKIILILTLLFLVGCTIEAQDTFSIDSVELTTDKDIYHSNEIIQITSNINSPAEIKNATIHFYGIHASRNRLEKTMYQDLTSGENIVTYEFQAPRCYGCAGVKPGTYKINVDVIYNEQVLSTKTIDIELRQ